MPPRSRVAAVDVTGQGLPPSGVELRAAATGAEVEATVTVANAEAEAAANCLTTEANNFTGSEAEVIAIAAVEAHLLLLTWCRSSFATTAPAAVDVARAEAKGLHRPRCTARGPPLPQTRSLWWPTRRRAPPRTFWR